VPRQRDIEVGGQLWTVHRLTLGEEYEAINAFAWEHFGTQAPVAALHALEAGCRVLYRDDHDAGRSYYRVVDTQVFGDGTQQWKSCTPQIDRLRVPPGGSETATTLGPLGRARSG
jgi:hypothetical protein